MTVPAGVERNWCPVCEDSCADHSRICTVCGSELQYPRSSTDTATTSNTERVDLLVPAHLRQDTLRASRELRAYIGSLRQRIDDVGQEQQTLLDELQNNAQEWQAVPRALLDPAAASHRGRPTSKAYLASLTRTKLTAESNVFRSATLSVAGQTMSAIPGEFGPTASFETTADLIVADPRTGKGGLSTATLQAIRSSTAPTVYFERGDGVTFVQKALMAQEASAVAVVIGNHVAEPWPYTMRDSKGEADNRLKIPVVMVKQSDGRNIVDLAPAQCHLRIHHAGKECVVCQDAYARSQTVLQLPLCGHVFHDQCAMSWLSHHNTCPYCRRELPTDDEAYDEERRRQQRTHAGSETAGYGSVHFYG